MTKILVTGGSGFIGRNLVKELLRDKTNEIVELSRKTGDDYYPDSKPGEVVVWPGNINYGWQTTLSVKRFNPDVVFHLAANPNVKTAEPLQIANDYKSLLELILACKPMTRFVYISSASVYGNETCLTYGTENSYCRPSSLYGAAKLAGEALILSYTSLAQISGLIIRSVANVGRHSTHGLVHDIVRKLKSGSPELELFGDAPGSVKPYVWVEDTARALAYFGLKTDVHGPLNLSADPLSVEEVAKIVMETLRIEKPIKWLGKGSIWAGDNNLLLVDDKKMKQFDFHRKANSSTEAIKLGLSHIVQGFDKTGGV